MIELDPLSQQRLVARIGARKRGKVILREDVFQAAARGFAPDAIGEHYGRTAKWAEQILRRDERNS